MIIKKFIKKLNRKLILFLILISSSLIYLRYIPSSHKVFLRSKFPDIYFYFRSVKDDFKEESNLEILSFWHSISKEVYRADELSSNMAFDPNEVGAPGGYIDLISSNKILGLNGKGDMFLFTIDKNKFSKVKSNLKKIYNDQNFQTKEIKNLKGKFGFRDILVDSKNNKILVSLWIDSAKNKKCYAMSIFEAQYNPSDSENILKKGLVFKEFFKTKECKSNFNGHASGGRIKMLNENIIFTVGDYDHSRYGEIEIPQDKNTSLGKVISIDKKGGYKVLSMGHRNQQGLLIKGDKIFITEHGPRGGDEINIIKNKNQKLNHYGWPFFAYGTSYEKEETFRTSHKGIFKKPAFYFSPGIAISEIIFYEGNDFPYWKNKFIISSLKDKSIYIMDFDNDEERFISSEKILIGSRIRDLLATKDEGIFLMTDDQKLIRLLQSDESYIKPGNKINIIENIKMEFFKDN